MAARYRIYKFDTSSVTGSTDSLATAIDARQSAVVLSSGTGTKNGTVIQLGVPPSINTTGGGGSGAVVTIVLTGGVITGLTIVSGGSGYTANFSATISGSGTGASVTLLVSGGVVTGYTSLVGGSGYNYESMIITKGGGTASLTVIRGWAGTVAAAWSSAATVHVPGELTYDLLQIANVPNHQFTFVKVSSDINYVNLVPAGGDTLQSGEASVILPDPSPTYGTTRLVAPGVGTVWIQFGDGSGLLSGGSAGGNAPIFVAGLQGYGAITIDGLIVPNQTDDTLVEFNVLGVDETDIAWWGQGSIGGSNPGTLPAIFNGIAAPYHSRFGQAVNVTGGGGTGYTHATITFIGGGGSGAAAHAVISSGAVEIVMDNGGFGYTSVPIMTIDGDGTGAFGLVVLAPLGVSDCFVWNDPGSYEICQVMAIDSGGVVTVARGLFGSPIAGHTGDYFKLVNTGYMRSVISEHPEKLIAVNQCVCAVVATANGQQYYQRMAPASDGQPPRPGLRTMSGNAYTSLGIVGPLAAGQTSIARMSTQDWEAVRAVYAKVRMPSAGGSIIVAVLYFAANGDVGLIDYCVIPDGEYCSYLSSDPPAGRQMPYHVNWPIRRPDSLDWPPNKMPLLTSGLDASGNPTLPLTFIPGNVLLAPDGAPNGSIDIIVTQVGSTTAGSDLIVTVQT